MEIQRSSRELSNHVTNTSDETTSHSDILPPPPTPFPVELLETDTGQSSTVHRNLADLQSSCVQVLSSLLPDTNDIGPETVDILPQDDRQLAGVLMELLEVSYELERLRPPASDLQEEARQDPSPHAPLHPTINVVREELAWSRIDSLAAAVSGLLEFRSQRNYQDDPFASHSDLHETQPPAYSVGTPRMSSDQSSLPGYQDHGEFTTEKKGGSSTNGQDDSLDTDQPREQMVQGMDNITSAIGRLTSLNPQLESQRVQLRPSSSSFHTSHSQDQRESEKNKERELEEIWERIERAHGKRRAVEQRVDRDGWRERRSLQREQFLDNLIDRSEASRLRGQDSEISGPVDAELARARDLRARDHFLRNLVSQTEEGRLSDQDVSEPEDSLRRQKHQSFVGEIIARTQAGRLDKQDFPQSVEDKLAERKEVLISNLVDYSSSGRLIDQDSLPPTPKPGFEDPFELVTVHDFLSRPPDRRGSSTSDHLTKSSRSRSSSVAVSENGDRKAPTAFKKVAGFVRRRSSFGLKLPDTDLSSIAYIAEHQENLRTVQVIFHGVGVSLKSDFTLQTGDISSTEASLSSKSLSTKIALPATVSPSQSNILTRHDLVLETKLAASPPPITTQALLPSQALSAPSLRQMRPTGLCCTSCDREIADVSSASSDASVLDQSGFKDLPSEHWAEMMEVWMCHSDPGFTAQLAQTTKDGFWPTNGKVLVGGSYLLIHPADVKRGNLIVELSNNMDAWQVVSCTCGEILGKQKKNDGKPGSGTMRFSKWAIALLKEDGNGESVEPVRFPLSVFIVSDMLELAQAHATYRFVISDEETDERRLLIWLFNPSIGISYRQSISAPLPSPLKTPQADKRHSNGQPRRRLIPTDHEHYSGSITKTLRAAKIMYKVIENDADPSESNLPGFGAGGQIEQLLYSRNVCDRLISALRDSTGVYPVSKRVMAGFDVGFLERY